MTIDTSRNTDEAPVPRRSRYLTAVLLLLTALALNAVCFGAVLLTAQSPPGPPDAPYTGPPAVLVGATATCPDGVALTVTMRAGPFPDLLPADEVRATVTTRFVNGSSAPLTNLAVSIAYDPALREQAEVISLPTTDPALPLAPGGSGTQTNEFAARAAGLDRFDISVTSDASDHCILDFRDAGPIAAEPQASSPPIETATNSTVR